MSARTATAPAALDPATAEKARNAVMFATTEAARLSGAGGWIEQLARSSHASRILAEATSDGDLVTIAVDHGDHCAMEMAAAPAGGVGDVALKLARLVADLLADFDGYPRSVQQLALAASALADCATLAGGLIVLPADAAEGVPDAATAARWIARHKKATRP